MTKYRKDATETMLTTRFLLCFIILPVIWNRLTTARCGSCNRGFWLGRHRKRCHRAWCTWCGPRRGAASRLLRGGGDAWRVGARPRWEAITWRWRRRRLWVRLRENGIPTPIDPWRTRARRSLGRRRGGKSSACWCTQICELTERAGRRRHDGLWEEICGGACVDAADQLHAAVRLAIDHLRVNPVNGSKLVRKFGAHEKKILRGERRVDLHHAQTCV